MKAKYLSVSEMIRIEKASDKAGHTYDRMMACAGRSLADEIIIAYRHEVKSPTVLGLVGSGNNGGDTLVAMAHLERLGWKCQAFLTSQRDGDYLLKKYIEAGGIVFQFDNGQGLNQLRRSVMDADILIDGVLGTGIRLPVRSPVSEMLHEIKEAITQRVGKPLIVAVDCPSGIDCDSGEAFEECIHADLTVCMAAVKKGLLKLPAFGYVGKLIVGDIGLNPNLAEWRQISRFVIDADALSDLPKRPLDSHKGTFGTALVVGGSKKFPGAPILAGKAAFRSGVGWVEIGIPEFLHPFLAGHFTEATWSPLPDDGDGLCRDSSSVLIANSGRATAVLIGPGLNVGNGSEEFIKTIIGEIGVPMVVDADGLKLIAKIPDWWNKIQEEGILTPHPGEMSVLTGWSVDKIQLDRVAAAEKFAMEWKQVVVLKGAFTVVAAPNGATGILPIATPALARAGTGDVLAGLITGLRAQGVPAFEAACAGVWLHAQAGFMAAAAVGSTGGVLAGDLIEQIASLLPE